jgi:uncharacterized protein YbjT (DUF2867 family)
MAGIYLVVGATGRLGQKIVSKLLRQNEHVRVLVRDAEKSRALLGENLEHFLGDVRHIDSLQQAVTGVQTVICTAGTHDFEGGNSPQYVDFEGVQNLVLAAQQAGVQRFVLVSSIGATQPDHPLNEHGKVLEWKYEGEEALRRSTLPYTIVRPGGLTDEGEGQSAIQISQGDKISGRISRADVAAVVVHAVGITSTHNTTFEVISEPGQPPSDWAALFESLEPDSEHV